MDDLTLMSKCKDLHFDISDTNGRTRPEISSGGKSWKIRAQRCIYRYISAERGRYEGK